MDDKYKYTGKVDFRHLAPIIEFGALMRFLEENDMQKEILKARSQMADLAGIYDKLRKEMPASAQKTLDKLIDAAYQRFLDDLDKQLGLWH